MDMFASDIDYESFAETTDSEDQDDSESSYDGYAQAILSSLDESMRKIDEIFKYERGFFPGDTVCSVKNPSGQLGLVLNVDVTVDLETHSGVHLKNVNSKQLIKVRSLESGDYVVQGSWLGKVDKVLDAISIVFSDEARYEIVTGDVDTVIPISSSLYVNEPYPYYPGQRVRIKSPSCNLARWLCSSWKANHDEGTVCNMEIGCVHVNWVASLMIGHGVTPNTPSRLQDPKSLTLLSCFPHANWQLGDWCIVPSDCIQNLHNTHESSNFESVAPKHLDKMHRFGTNEACCKRLFVIAKIKTKVDVLWQDGSKSFGLDSQSLLSVNTIGDHDFFPGQYVLEKVTSEEAHVSTTQRVGIVKKVDSLERTVTVKWTSCELKQMRILERECTEETVSAYELMEYPNFSYRIGDIVFKLFPNYDKSKEFTVQQDNNMLQDSEWLMRAASYLSCIGTVVGYEDEGVEVKWASGLTSTVLPSDIFRLDQLDAPASTREVNEGAISENISNKMVEQEKHFSPEKVKIIGGSGEVHGKDMWNINALYFPRMAVGFFANVATGLFGSRSTTFPYSDLKEPLELQSSETEELQFDANVGKESIYPPKENSQNEQPVTSPGKGAIEKFKQFDIVDDYSDHYYVNSPAKEVASPMVRRGWLKKIQQEWSILEKDLPDSIHVRVYEERIELLRASIAGADGTPYHDGLFLFDICFPPDYPDEPPLVHYNSGGLRLNPNLYESGKVCLSLLKTWTGTGTEVWNPKSSTILQLLLSLQALVLNEKPYFNEAGYDRHVGRAEGEKNSISYNENTFILSCKTMLYLLRKPPKHFEALVTEHFAARSHRVLETCNAYMEGIQVGCPFEGRVAEDKSRKSNSDGFRMVLAKLVPKLVSGFKEKGFLSEVRRFGKL